ncbi:hypothetical protein [Streptomyces sp. AK02-01A]|uniref:hypothetical protein n=1 Tax=Streptomyces sp. AK02-01A TaxID=3028648 RepID=UPI0029B31DE5|nr:hypothetical protein [Streptomyces sp. AK02-01A]MDX3849484.1 hypothetical protein [Streptomyces sp. AK02-01A]
MDSTGQIEVFGDPTDRTVTAPAQLAISAVDSGVNERRGRGFFFPMLSMTDTLPGQNP